VKIAATAFVLLLSSIPLAAQNGAKPESRAFVLRAQPVVNGCPIGMVASQGVWDHTIRVRQGQEGQNPQPLGQRIFLTLNDTHSAPIVAATVKVYGLTAKNHMVQTDNRATADGDATKTMSITFATRQKNGVSSDLYIPGFTAVNSIELVQVSYDDGRVWRIGADSVCRVTPDPMMLIANH
jgi:hypothetical protein